MEDVCSIGKMSLSQRTNGVHDLKIPLSFNPNHARVGNLRVKGSNPGPSPSVRSVHLSLIF